MWQCHGDVVIFVRDRVADTFDIETCSLVLKLHLAECVSSLVVNEKNASCCNFVSN